MAIASWLILIAALLAQQPVSSQSAPTAQTSTPAATLDYEFFKSRVQPMFLVKREGLVRCVQCHARGTGSGFNLQPLPEGASTWTEEQSRKNFEATMRFVTPGDPTSSRLLMHPLARAAGGDPFHGGGKHFPSQDAAEWQTLAEWVNTPVARADATSAVALDYAYFKTQVQPLFVAKREGLVRCIQCHSRGTGSGFLLQPLPEGTTAWNEEQSRQNFESARRLVSPGAPTASRLLMHPLARTAGGDPFHGGGKHWGSQESPEWQTLANWVNGRTASGSSR
jgi:hypothetical protein